MKLHFDGPGGVRVVDIDREMSVGRAPENEIALNDTQVSRRHALVRPVGGRVEVEDLDSYNGTFVNGQKVSIPVVVGPGDTILFGETTATAGEDESLAEAPAFDPLPGVVPLAEQPAPAPEPPPPPRYEEPAAAPDLPMPPPPRYEEPAAFASEPPPAPQEPAQIGDPDYELPPYAVPPPPPRPQEAAAAVVPESFPPPPPAPSQEAATAVMREEFPSPPPPPAFVPETATVVGQDAWTPPPPAQIPRLIVRTGHDEGKELALMEGNEVLIGRDGTTGFMLNDPRVSSRHARVYLQGGRLVIEDLGSANGTYVNGARVTTPMVAEEGSEIQVGESMLLFTRQPTSFFSGSPSPTLVGARIDSSADVQHAVEEAVARSEKSRRSKSLIYTAIGGTIAVVVGAGIGAFFLAGGGDDEPTTDEVVERVKPATVRVDSYTADGFPFSGGSGSIIDLDEGIVLTNNHVASVGHLEIVNSVNNESIEAVLLGAAPCDDLALVVADGLNDAADGLKQVEFGDATTLRQGEHVIALGYPGAAEQFVDRALSATTGVVSKTKTVYDVPGSGLPFLPNVIQTDAAINPGNSGGPLFDLDGTQIGVNTARFVGPAGAQSENYAVSITRVNEIIEDLRAGRSPHWIGATFDELTDQNGTPTFLAIADVTPGGPAEELGLTGPVGDDYAFAILAIDGEEVFTLQDYCAVIPADGTATLTIYVVETDEVVDVDIEVGGTAR